MTAADLTLTMPDIAELAGVERSVVTMWRKRAAGGRAPFPDPVEPGAARLRYRAEEVADWIEQGKKGKNPQFRADAAVMAAVSGDGDPVRSLAAVTALLALAPYASVPLDEMSGEDLLDLADEVDPYDGFAYQEVAELGERLGAAAQHASRVASAAYNPASATERVLAKRHRFDDARLTSTCLQPAGLALVAEVVAALVPDDAELTVTDPWPGCGDLLTAVLGRTERVEPVVALLPPGDDDVVRLARRRLATHGIPVPAADRTPPGTSSDDGDRAAGPVDVRAHLVTQIPALHEPDCGPAEVLGRLEEVQLGLADGKVAVVVGPASALIDELADRSAETIRDDILRSGRVRSAILLPAGLIASRPRQKTAIWVLGDVPAGASFAEQHLAVADLSEHALGPRGFTEDVVHDLLTDVVAAQGTMEDARSHHFRFARFLKRSTLVARGRGLLGTARAIDDRAPLDPAAQEQRIADLMARLAAPGSSVLLPRVHGIADGESGLRYTVAELEGQGHLHRRSGIRIETGDLALGAREGTVPVIGPAEVTGKTQQGERRIDKLHSVWGRRSAQFTEPGDVVYVTSPRPAAVVDADGLSAVQSPARILRVPEGSRTRLVPEVIAADINALGAEARKPDEWAVRLVPAQQGAPLASALGALRTEEQELRLRLDTLSSLRTSLVDGVAAGAVGLDVRQSREDERGR